MQFVLSKIKYQIHVVKTIQAMNDTFENMWPQVHITDMILAPKDYRGVGEAFPNDYKYGIICFWIIYEWWKHRRNFWLILELLAGLKLESRIMFTDHTTRVCHRLHYSFTLPVPYWAHGHRTCQWWSLWTSHMFACRCHAQELS